MNIFKKLELERISEEEAREHEYQPHWRQEYKKDHPPSQALVVSDGSRARAVEHVGPDFDYWFGEAQEFTIFDGLAAGVWICEIQTVDVKHWTDYGYEYDFDLTIKERKLTDEEWEHYMNEELPWDEKEWIK